MSWKLEDLSVQDQQKLDSLVSRLKIKSNELLGYPVTCKFNFEPLFELLRFPINNVGDPYISTHFSLSSHEFEREVLETFQRWTHAPENETWGYVTNGGTEGNMYGIYLARELYPDGMVYFSEDTHYSVSKSLKVLHARNIMIKSQPNGEMDYEDLAETLRIHRDVPPIIFANIGTTMKGAVDNLERIQQILSDLALHEYYVHADAALSGMILPFVDHPQPYGFDAGIDSISISGHKMVGSPIPCGIVLARKKNVERIARSVEYVGSLDTTLSGSRNGITPVFLWFALKTVGQQGFEKIIKQCIDTASYAIQQMKEVGIDAWRNTNSNTVVFPKPSSQVINKWQLAVEKNITHVICMPHVSRQHIDELINDLIHIHPTPSRSISL